MSLWGKTAQIAAAIPAGYIGVSQGIYNVVSRNGTFREGFDKSQTVLDAAEKLGDKYDEDLTQASHRRHGDADQEPEVKKDETP